MNIMQCRLNQTEEIIKTSERISNFFSSMFVFLIKLEEMKGTENFFTQQCIRKPPLSTFFLPGMNENYFVQKKRKSVTKKKKSCKLFLCILRDCSEMMNFFRLVLLEIRNFNFWFIEWKWWIEILKSNVLIASRYFSNLFVNCFAISRHESVIKIQDNIMLFK